MEEETTVIPSTQSLNSLISQDQDIKIVSVLSQKELKEILWDKILEATQKIQLKEQNRKSQNNLPFQNFSESSPKYSNEWIGKTQNNFKIPRSHIKITKISRPINIYKKIFQISHANKSNHVKFLNKKSISSRF